MGGPTQAERHAHPLIPEYSPELFRGAAEYYSRFRPRYPAVLLDAIRRTVDLDHVGSLVDLACGTGEVCLALPDSLFMEHVPRAWWDRPCRQELGGLLKTGGRAGDLWRSGYRRPGCGRPARLLV